MLVLFASTIVSILPMTFAAISCHQGNETLICASQRHIPSVQELKSSNITNFNLSGIKEIDLSNGHISSVTHVDYADIRQLSRLDLSRNKIINITQDAFVSDIYDLDLSHNELTPNSFFEQSIFSSFEQKSINNLSLAFNRFENISKKLFDGFSDIKVLNISSCFVSTIAPKAFEYLPGIHILDLSSNRLTQIVPGWFEKMGLLEVLYLSHNFLTTVGPQHLTTLSSLSLSYNKIGILQDHWFSDCQVLTKIDLSHNKLKTLTNLSLPWEHDDMEIKLDGNPWVCDCKMKWLTEAKKRRKIICASPRHLTGLDVFDQDEKTLCQTRSLAVTIASISAVFAATVFLVLLAVLRKKRCRFRILSTLLRGQASYKVIYNEDPDEPVTKIYLSDDKGDELLKKADDV